MLAIIPHFDTRYFDRVGFQGRTGRARSVGLLVLIGLALWTFSAPVAPAGTIRHDRDDSLYTSLAALPQYDCAGMVQLGSNIGSGTLIASEWVLTAGHMSGDGATFTVDGTAYDAVAGSYQKHPSEDIGVFRLSLPVSGVIPAMLFEPTFGSEVGLDGTMVGFGNTGSGLSGETPLTTGTKRAGQNSIDATGSFWNWSSNLLLVDFDS
ncbi:MAG: hypothetical protein U9N87_09560, partial [Planctomycetota bacterium]|nr:hypothetical protein [Planctomycetota bacterium]